MLYRTLAIALLLCLTGRSLAQPMVDRVPADAWLYVGWSGTASVSDAYAQSRLNDVLQLIDLEAVSDVWAGLMQKLSAEADNPEAQEALELFQGLRDASFEGPMALYVMPTVQDRPPTVVAMWTPQGEASRQSLLTTLRRIEAESDGMATVTIEPIVDGDLFTLCIGQPAEVGQEPQWLKDDAGFQAASTGVRDVGALVAYVNVPGLMKLASKAAANSGNPNAIGVPKAFAVMDALALNELGPLMVTAGFEGPDWRTAVFLSAPSPRKGVAKLLEPPALSVDELSAIPTDAAWASAFSFDVGTAVDLAREAFTAAGDEEADGFERGLAMASGMFGVDIEERLLRGLGTTWFVYTDSTVAGAGYSGVTLVNPLKDAEGVSQALRSVEVFANAMLKQQMADEDGAVQFYTRQIDGVEVHTLPIALAAPSWAVIEGRLVVGLYPQSIVAAMDRGTGGAGIVAAEAFEQVKPRIGTRRLTGLTMINLRETAASAYGMWLTGEHLATGVAAYVTQQAVPMILPPLGRLKPLLRPVDTVSWVDDAGWHRTSIGPFPGAVLLSPQGTSQSFTAPLAVGVMLPALGAARRTARQMTDSTNARAIHQAMVMHAQTRDAEPGRDRPLTDDISDLTEGHYITPEMLLSSSTRNAVPLDYHAWPEAQRRNWVRQNAEFILVPGLNETYATDEIAVFLNPDMQGQDGDRRGSVTRNDNSTSIETDWAIVEDMLIRQTGMDTDELIARQKALVE